jgi:hypothetical protein
VTWEKRLLGRKYTVRREGVEYFTPDSKNLKSVTSMPKPGKDVQVGGVTYIYLDPFDLIVQDYVHTMQQARESSFRNS